MINRFRRSTHSICGYNVVELSIGLAITAGIVLIAALAARGFRAASELEQAKLDLIQEHQYVEKILRDDLNAALLINGGTRRSTISLRNQNFNLVGIQRGTNAPRNGNENDSMMIFRTLYPGFSMYATAKPLMLISCINNVCPATFTLTKDPNDDPRVFDYLKSTAQKYEYFALTGTVVSNVFHSTVLGVQLTNTFEVTGKYTEGVFDANEELKFGDLKARYQSIIRVEYVIDGTKLLRNVYDSDPTTPRLSQVVSNRIRKFQVNYAFFDRERMGQKVIPEAPISHIFDSDYQSICAGQFEGMGQLCVTWNDILHLNLAIEYENTGLTLKQTANSELVSGFSVSSDNYLVYTKENLRIEPASYRAVANADTVVDDECPLSDPQNTRCSQNCSHVFTSNDRNSPNWSGYGDPNGPYCQCYKDSNGYNYDLEANPNPLNWANESERAQIMACRQVAGCNYARPQDDPEAFLACRCVQPKNQAIYPDGSGLWEVIPNLLNGVNPIISGAGDSNILCSNWDKYSAQGYDCFSQARRLDPSIPASPNFFEQTCGCRTREVYTDQIDGSGGEEIANTLSGETMRWDLVCNLAHFNSGGAQACPDTLDGANYKTFDPENPDRYGLTEQQKLVCACLRAHRSGSNADLARSDDFRNPAVSCGNEAQGWPNACVSKTFNGQSCGALICREMPGNNLSCCTDPTIAVSNESFITAGGSDGLNGDPYSTMSWKNYCSNQCGGNAGQVNMARDRITYKRDGGQGSALHPLCGGSIGGNNGQWY